MFPRPLPKSGSGELIQNREMDAFLAKNSGSKYVIFCFLFFKNCLRFIFAINFYYYLFFFSFLIFYSYTNHFFVI